MDLTWQNDIINGLIKENPESTINDYWELLQVLNEIEQSYGNRNPIQHGDANESTPPVQDTPVERGLSIDRTICHYVLSYPSRRVNRPGGPTAKDAGGTGIGGGEGPIKPSRRKTGRRKALTPDFATENREL
jgi:hypothetical protein